MDNKIPELQKYHKLKMAKQRWYELYQLIGEYVHLNKQDFQTTNQKGDFLTEHIFDSTGPKSMRQAANGLLSMVWKNAKQSMVIQKHDDIEDTPAVKKYFEDMHLTVAEAMDDVKAGLAIALEEYMFDQMSFGTSGIGVFDGTDSELLFKSAGIEDIFIDEGPNGFVNCVYLVREYDIEGAVAEFGLENLSESYRKCYEGGQTDKKIMVLHAVEPRTKRDKTKLDNMNMPIKSKHIEIDTKHVIKESGYNEMPYYISRFYKKNNEKYGRSPAMDALPDILEINNLKEARSVGIEKKLDPPLGMFHDSVAGNGRLDTSPRSINIIKSDGRQVGSNPVFPLFSVGDIREADKGIEELTLSIKEHFMLDRFLDTQNTTQMTLGEFTERQQRTAEAMQSVFTRVIREVLDPIIERSVSLLWRQKKLGMWNITEGGALVSDVIPEEIVAFIGTGRDFYKVQYMTPAARIMMSEESQGILRTWEFAGQLAQAKPEVLDLLNADKSLKRISEIAGATSTIFVDDEQVQKIRELRQQQQEQAAQQEQAMQAAAMAAQVQDGQTPQ